MKKTTIICIILMLSVSVFAYENNGHDEYEVRYIKGQITTDITLQQILREQNAWQKFLVNHPHWFVSFNQFNLKPHRAYGEPIDLLNGTYCLKRGLKLLKRLLFGPYEHLFFFFFF